MPVISQRPAPAPAFGQADLSNCEREQIHLAGSIQPHGALLVVDEEDGRIVQASTNAASFLGLPDDLLGRRLDELPGDVASCIAPHRQDPLDAIPAAVRCRVGDPAAAFDCLLHRPPGGGLVLELERAGPAVDLVQHVDGALRTVVGASSLRALCDDTARVFRRLTGYDRVMVYRFDEEGHGEVFSEQREPHLEPYLGNRYPASDIPQMARRLYMRNRVRVLVDVEARQAPVLPPTSATTAPELDMSLCFLRSMSPIHVQYLRNMGVRATLVASLVVGGRLWGLVACHHYVPRFVHFEIRAVAELLAEAIGTRIAALESFAQAQAELSVRRLEQRMIAGISRDGDWRRALFDGSAALLQPLAATGAALVFEDEILTVGEVPGTPQLRQIAAWLDEDPPRPILATAQLGLDAPQFAPLTAIASGLLAAAISNQPGEYIVWFRPERVRTVTWGGDPSKPMVIGDDPADLSPRRSFAQWHQVVEGKSDPWTPADRTTATLIGETVTDVVIQFRSVRMLIVENQLEQVRRQVQRSEQPVLVAEAGGRILHANDAFRHLLPPGRQTLRRLDDLPGLFTDPAEARRRLRELTHDRRSWRGEAALAGADGGPRPILVRADPVYSAPGKVLGLVVLLTDLVERKAADAARRRFQEGIVDSHRGMAGLVDSPAGLLYRNLLATVVENAQMAGLDITDGVEVARMPEMLESVRTSVERTAALLEHLVRHAARTDDASDPE